MTLTSGGGRGVGSGGGGGSVQIAYGRAMQVNPIKPMLKAPGTDRLRLKIDQLLSTSAVKCNLRRYITGAHCTVWTSPGESLTSLM
jgi:hypothetical protein